MSEITFILPTYNRKEYVVRAIESCLALEVKNILPQVIVIDGFSNDGAWEILEKKYQDNNKVTLIQYPKKGFQRTAFFGVSLVKTEYATFMYNDDVLSPFFHKYFEKMIKTGNKYFMGYGLSFPIEQVYKFKNINLKMIQKEKILKSYFGSNIELNHYSLPVSPIASIMTKKFLNNWVNFTNNFARETSLRKNFMIDLNVGPDIILYLSNIISQKKNVLFADGIVAQFSEHKDSMSIGYGTYPLTIGYWLGRIWAINEIHENHNDDGILKNILPQCSGYLIVSGIRIILILIYLKKFKWSREALLEVIDLLKKAYKNKILIKTLYHMIITIKNRFQRYKYKALPS